MSTNHPIDYSQVINRLKADYSFKESGKHLIQGRCPECGKRELHTHVEKPYAVVCNRLNKCGYEETIQSLYPDLYEDYTKKYPATDKDPNLTAKKYLNDVRGFDVAKLNGWFEQGMIHDAEHNVTTATVKFWLDKENGVSWERLIDHARHFGKKARFLGKLSGNYWMPPTIKHIDPERPLYLVEGIFDCIALWFCGVQAASIMTTNNWPKKLIERLDKNQTIVWALDNNKAGITWGKKYRKQSQDLGFDSFLAIPTHPKDWNDLYILKDPDTMFDVMDQAIWNGEIHAASTAGEAAALYVAQTRKPYRIIQKGNAYWEAKYDRSKLEKDVGDKDDPEMLNGFFKRDTLDLIRDDIFLNQIKSAIRLEKLSNCVAKFEYQQVDQYNDQDRLNYFEISYENGSPKSTISIPGTALAYAGSFNQALLRNTPGARFTGGKAHIEYLHENIWFYKPAKEVKTLNFCGYDHKSGAYVFNETAFLRGKRHEINQQGFFDLKDVAIKSVNRDVRLKISSRFDAVKFMHHFQGAYGERGLIVFSWWVGSLFAEQLRDHFQGYPFFELQGQASSGKSTLIKILWKLFGREDYEGFNPLNSSFSAIDRNFAKTSNMPVVLIESDANDEQRNAKKFNWEHLKNAYTGEPLKERGVQNGGNETVFNPFRATLMAAQNTAIEGSEAILSRFIHLPLDRTHHLPGGKLHAETLARADVEEISGFLPFMLRHENEIIKKIIELTPVHYKAMTDLSIRIDRIKDNHAMLMAILETLCAYLPIDQEITMRAMELIRQRAIKRQLDTQVDNPSVQELWDIYEYLNVQEDKDDHIYGAKEILNHSKDSNLIAINLVQFEQACKQRGIKPPDMVEVKRHIKQSHRFKFVDYKSVNSKISDKAVRCFIFRNDKRASE
ncbi:MAG: toprim domain-containing protein [Thiotrichales bacterium]|nr:toprim domain-containing protein [Thiotrichales bacterium]